MTTSPAIQDPTQDRERIYSKILNHFLSIRESLVEESPLIRALEEAARLPDILLPNLCLDEIRLRSGGIELNYSAGRPKGAVEKDYWKTLVEKGVFSQDIVSFIYKGLREGVYEDTGFYKQGPFQITLRIYTRPFPESPKE